MYHLSFQGYLSQAHSASSITFRSVQVLPSRFLIRWVMSPASLCFRSQVLHRCCGRRHLEPMEDGREDKECGEVHAHPASVPAVVGRVPGTVIWCTKNNKNHIARDFHSFTAQQVTRPCYISTVGCLCVVSLAVLLWSDTGCCYGVEGINTGEV